LIIVRVYIQHKGRKPDQEPGNNGADVWKNQGDIRDVISIGKLVKFNYYKKTLPNRVASHYL